MQVNRNKGFTLMEMLIVVTIIGILAAIVLPRFVTSSKQAKREAHKAERQSINAQIELYYFNEGEWPDDMTDAGWGTADEQYQDYFPDGVPTTCNQGGTWTIGDNYRIDLAQGGHDGHE
ncbi:competence type IV pilus major pilin ComGC [Thermoproteota archaeon]